MKLKYYMRGLGIGIILTTLILSLGGQKEKLTDKEIMKRAGTLGMVLEDKTKDNMNQVLEDPNSADEATVSPEPSSSPEASTAPVPSTVPKPSVTPIPTDTPKPSVTPVPTDTPKPTKIPDKTETKTPGPTPKIVPVPKPGEEDTASGNQTSEGNIEFTIKAGMSSEKVAEMLEKSGLIKDAVNFNQYVTQKSKTDEIMIGTYSLPKGASYEIILDTITFH